MKGRCEYCKNRATRQAVNRHGPVDSPVDLCEVHYAYLKPGHSKVNPADVGRCIRCGHKALNRSGTDERLIDHHVNYPLDLTVPVCDACHREIHNSAADDESDVQEVVGPFDPVGTTLSEGVAIHDDYRDDGTGETCPDCGAELISSIDDMGMDSPYLCPDSACLTTVLGVADLEA